MSEPAQPPIDRSQSLADTRARLSQLEAEAHRLRAQLSRLEAEGNDDAAERIEAELASLSDERSQLSVLEPAPSGEPTPAPDRETRETTEKSKRAKRPSTHNGAVAPPSEKAAAPEPREQPAGVVPDFNVGGASDEEEPTPRRRSAGELARSAPPWLASLLVHAALLMMLFLWTFTTLTDTPRMLLGSAPDGEDEYFEDVPQIDFSDLDFEELESDVELESLDVESPSVELMENPLDAAAGITDFNPGMASALPSDMASLLMGERGGVEGAKGRSGKEPGGAKGGTQFFGARSAGNRFCFVVDNSATMKGGRMETTLMELQRAIFSLNPDQSFYVIFYSDQVYPLFYPTPVEEMLPATPENKQKLAQWLTTVQMCYGGRAVTAMREAAELEPTVVYLLSDGDFGETTAQTLSNDNGWEFIIHTLGMTVREERHARYLFRIASRHNGTFTPVGVNPVAAQMAEQRPITVHRTKTPSGWGSKVRR